MVQCYPQINEKQSTISIKFKTQCNILLQMSLKECNKALNSSAKVILKWEEPLHIKGAGHKCAPCIK